MEVFQKDHFSSGHKALSEPSASVRQEVADTLGEHYGLPLEETDTVNEFQGLGVNSRNFQLTTSQGNFVLKKNLKQSSKQQFEAQLVVANETGLHVSAMPTVRRTRRGSLIASDDKGRLWVLSDLFEGDHFTGSGGQIEAVAHKLVRFRKALAQAPSAKNLPVFASAEKNAATHETLRSFFELEDRIEQFFPPAESAVLKNNSDLLREALQLTRSYSTANQSSYAPTHIDLHPHNLLVARDGEVAILDYDSLFVTDSVQFMSYSALKLLRQVACIKGKKYAISAMDEFLDTEIIADTTRSGCAAVTEVLRRIAIILDLNMRKVDTEWNSVLGMLLCNLKEAAVLFQLEIYIEQLAD
jgi:Ser/Thr protein kinase RdoA (MazF antagonist)